jgi:hypothetical protein
VVTVQQAVNGTKPVGGVRRTADDDCHVLTSGGLRRWLWPLRSAGARHAVDAENSKELAVSAAGQHPGRLAECGGAGRAS